MFLQGDLSSRQARELLDKAYNGPATYVDPSEIEEEVGVIVSPDESRGYLGFSTVMPPLQRFPFGCDNLKTILVRPFKFGMWVYMGNATNAIVLCP